MTNDHQMSMVLAVLVAATIMMCVAFPFDASSQNTNQLTDENLFFKAITDGDINLVKKMIINGMNVNVKQDDYFGRTPLIWAAYKGHIEIVRLLIEKGADMNSIFNAPPAISTDSSKVYFGGTALYAAAINGYTEIAKILIKAGADVDTGFCATNQCIDENSGEIYGYTALLTAARNGYLEYARLLINAKAKTFYTMKCATIYKDFKPRVLKLLIDAGANTKEKDESGKTILHYAFLYNSDIEKIKMILQTGAPLDEKDNDNLTAIDYAKKQGYKVEDLIR